MMDWNVTQTKGFHPEPLAKLWVGERQSHVESIFEME